MTPGGHGPRGRCFLQAPHMPRRFKSSALWLQPPAAFLWMINALTQSPGGFLCLFSFYNQVGGESGQVPRRFWTPDLPNQFLLWNSHWLQPSNFLCPALTRVTAERRAGEQVPAKLGPHSLPWVWVETKRGKAASPCFRTPYKLPLFLPPRNSLSDSTARILWGNQGAG